MGTIKTKQIVPLTTNNQIAIPTIISKNVSQLFSHSTENSTNKKHFVFLSKTNNYVKPGQSFGRQSGKII